MHFIYTLPPTNVINQAPNAPAPTLQPATQCPSQCPV
jgi:hypothetical protein